MDLTPARHWAPPAHWRRFTVIDSHTGGEPFRVVVDGLPDIPGDTVPERRRHASEHLDDLRRILMWEPRGHADMYGGWIGPPVEDDSDLSVLFCHNAGFSTMCGHGIIALTKVVLDTGVFPATEGDNNLTIDTPAGQVSAGAEVVGGRATRVRFRNVPSFAPDLDAKVDVPGLGTVAYDLGFGGAFYAYVEAASVGTDLGDAADLISKGRAIKEAIVASGEITHPTQEDLGFLYGVIFTGPALKAGNHSRNVCIFADGEVDRSPTGTGVSGRLAILHARGDITEGEAITVESIVGSEFTGQIVDQAQIGDIRAVIPEISGTAHIVGRAEFWVDPDDPLNPGFLVR
ncbi:MAG: proline racemase family protein [Acidimicrobiia bacterium]